VIIYFVGYLSNTNYDFQHLGMNLSKKIMLLKKIRAEDKANLLIISPEFENLRTVENKIKFCKIAASVGVLSLGELNMGASKNLGVSSNIQLFIGHPEKYSFLISKNLFYVNFLHHVEEVF
jgi:hypothetical protein